MHQTFEAMLRGLNPSGELTMMQQQFVLLSQRVAHARDLLERSVDNLEAAVPPLEGGVTEDRLRCGRSHDRKRM